MWGTGGVFGQRSVGLVVTNVGEACIICRVGGWGLRGFRCGVQEECLGRGR